MCLIYDICIYFTGSNKIHTSRIFSIQEVSESLDPCDVLGPDSFPAEATKVASLNFQSLENCEITN